jgi:hypothetical protein
VSDAEEVAKAIRDEAEKRVWSDFQNEAIAAMRKTLELLNQWVVEWTGPDESCASAIAQYRKEQGL